MAESTCIIVTSACLQYVISGIQTGPSSNLRNRLCHSSSGQLLASHRGSPGSRPVRLCGICGGQSGTAAGFLRVLRCPLPIIIPPNSPSS
jgi:hypothetical protein